MRFGKEQKMERSLREKTVNEVITLFLKERGADCQNEALRKQYPTDLIKKFQAGDTQALVELLRIGTYHGAPTRLKVNREEG